MSAGVLVRVETEIVILGEPASALWVVATDDPEKAVAIVRQRVSPGCKVEASVAKVHPETMQRLQLAPDQAWHL